MECHSRWDMGPAGPEEGSVGAASPHTEDSEQRALETSVSMRAYAIEPVREGTARSAAILRTPDMDTANDLDAVPRRPMSVPPIPAARRTPRSGRPRPRPRPAPRHELSIHAAGSPPAPRRSAHRHRRSPIARRPRPRPCRQPPLDRPRASSSSSLSPTSKIVPSSASSRSLPFPPAPGRRPNSSPCPCPLPLRPRRCGLSSPRIASGPPTDRLRGMLSSSAP